MTRTPLARPSPPKVPYTTGMVGGVNFDPQVSESTPKESR
jgi:hypothetical protein